MKYFGGVEGGATHSQMVICNENGETVASITGLSTNHWAVGIPECANRLAQMTDEAKKEANIPQCVKLDSLGLSLSGCEHKATNDELEEELRSKYPNVAKSYVVCSDTVGSIFTASPNGGLVLISGTGSNALVINPDKSTARCGGWGHMLGDEGSACWISHRAIKYVFDDMDNFIKSPYPIDQVWQQAKEHFSVETQNDLLQHVYSNFNKSFFAKLCRKLSVVAREGDKLAALVFEEAGRDMARYIQALADRVDTALVKNDILDVICVGSVWLSWDLLSKSFIKQLNTSPLPYGLRLLKITKTTAYGAAYMAADDVKFDMPRNYQDNYEVFHNYYPGMNATNGNSISR